MANTKKIKTKRSIWLDDIQKAIIGTSATASREAVKSVQPLAKKAGKIATNGFETLEDGALRSAALIKSGAALVKERARRLRVIRVLPSTI